MLIDTHCHLSANDYDNVFDLIKEMNDNNIYAIVNGCEENSNKECIELSKKYKNIFSAIGYHPEEINNINDLDLQLIRSDINNVVAIGEIGLDYYWKKDNKIKQKELLESQLKLAEENNLPVIIHSRESTMDIYNILKQYKLKGVIHAFSGSYEMANNFIKLGYKIGIGGVVTFKNSNLKDVVSKISLNDIVLETDSPYLTPEPNRGKKNSPLNLKYIAKYISDIKHISYEEVCNTTSANAIALFDLEIKL